MNTFYTKQNKGFTLLFAVIVSALILAVGLSIINLAIKENRLSAINKESAVAFYAANTGAECALYWDFQGIAGQNSPVFGYDGTTATNPPVGDVTCLGNNIRLDPEWLVTNGNGPNNTPITTNFRIYFGTDEEGCADVMIRKTLDTGAVGGQQVVTTLIESRGYNNCIDGNASRVERGLRVTY